MHISSSCFRLQLQIDPQALETKAGWVVDCQGPDNKMSKSDAGRACLKDPRCRGCRELRLLFNAFHYTQSICHVHAVWRPFLFITQAAKNPIARETRVLTGYKQGFVHCEGALRRWLKRTGWYRWKCQIFVQLRSATTEPWVGSFAPIHALRIWCS